MTREEYEARRLKLEQEHYEAVEIYNTRAAQLYKDRQSEWNWFMREMKKLEELFNGNDSHQRS